MIDLTNAKENPFKAYDGANGKKKCLIYNDEEYMVKFPMPKENLDIHYTNSCINEHIGSRIFRILGIDVQETFLARYRDKMVVACKDFCPSGESLILQSFAMMKNGCIESESSGHGMELQAILNAMDEQQVFKPQEMKEYFWKMFIVDALLGNFDRHNGNWGYLTDRKSFAKLAPVYDCGSCLFPQASDERMQYFLQHEEEMKARTFVFPNSALKIHGQKINYAEFLSSGQNQDCNKALLELAPVIRKKMPQICSFIDNVEEISPIRKSFYKQMITERNQHLIQEPARKLERIPYKSLDELIKDAKNDCPRTESSQNRGKEINL